MSITAWNEERSVQTTKAALQAAGSCRHKLLPCAIAGIAVSGVSSWAGKAFRLSQWYKQKMLDLPWMPSLRAQTPAWHGRDAEKRRLGICEKLPFWSFLAFNLWTHLCVLTLPWPQACAQGDSVSLPTNIPVKPSRLRAKKGSPYPPAVTSRCALAAFLLPPHLFSLFGTISVPKEKAVLLHVGDVPNPIRLPCAEVLLPAETQVRSRRGEMLQPLPLLVWVSLAADFCLRMFQRCSIFLQDFTRTWVGVGWEEGQDQPIRQGEGWLCSDPHSQKLTDAARQVPAHVSLNTG